MVKKYRVGLTEEEQEELKALVSKGRVAAYKQTHARILLLCDENEANGPMMDQEIAEAMRIARRLEIHYTPKHGSWLNIAEIELGVLARQCLDRRIPSQEILEQEKSAWQEKRNGEGIRVDWRFTTEDARVKLKSVNPSIQQ